ncbi:MAG: penicillin-binding protein activator [candidate division Zixibacteria bacterium]|nr:penicillin-binding protein activator [candidate division Zixibacteria bacterium]
MQRFLSKFAIICCLGLFLSPAAKVYGDEALFNQGRRFLNSGRYSEARRIFIDLCSTNADPQLAPRYQFYKAKAAYYANFFTESLNDFNQLIDNAPQSGYIPYAYFFAGNIQYRLRHTGAAIEAYLGSYKLSSNRLLDEIVLKSIESIAADPQSDVLRNISISTIPDKKKCDLVLAVGRGLMEQKKFQSVHSLLAYCSGIEADRMKIEADRLLKEQVAIGIILPLSGELQKYGEALLDGAMLMIDKYNREAGYKLTPIVYDTKGESVEAARIVRRLASDGMAAIIGPLTSEETAVVSAALSCTDVPLIIPTASQGGLTDLSSTSFQMQPTLDFQGARIAEYAIKKLKYDTAAIITPTTADNLRMAEAFRERFKELGGTIIGIEYFRPRETDFGSLILDLKSLANKNLSDSLTYINENGDTVETREVPVKLECLYVPADAEQLQLLLPQINFYNLQTIYLGGEGWSNKEIYELGKEITKACYFTSGRVGGDTGTILYRRFASDFNGAYGRAPGNLEALGYDAATLICNALRIGKYSRQEITHYLSGIIDYKGLAGQISFGVNRENILMPIYTIEAGQPKRIEY